MLNLSPSEFWAITPGEFFCLVDGYEKRNRQQLEMLAIHACWIINVWSKKTVRVRDLLKPDREGLEFTTSEETQEFLEDTLAFHKSKFWTKIPDKYAKK